MAAYPGNAANGFKPVAAPTVYAHAWAITADDANDITTPCAAVQVGTGGTISVQLAGVRAANPVTMTVIAGYIYPIQATRILATGTTATGLVALW